MYMLRDRNKTHGVPNLPPPQSSGSGPTRGAHSSNRNRSKYFGIETLVVTSDVTSIGKANSSYGPTPNAMVPVVAHIETG